MLLYAAFVADENWGDMLEPARIILVLIIQYGNPSNAFRDGRGERERREERGDTRREGKGEATTTTEEATSANLYAINTSDEH